MPELLRPKLNLAQYRFLQMPQKYRAYVAGFGSGKTWVGSTALINHFMQFPQVDAAYYAPTYKLIKDVFYPTIEEVAYAMGFDAKVKVGDHEVIIMHGRTRYGMVRCRSMDNPANIVGYKAGHSLVDELDVMETEKARLAWRKIIARMRYDIDGLKNGVDVTTTPEGFKFTYNKFVEEVIEKNLQHLYGLLKASTYDNEANLPKDYIPSLLADYPKELIEAYIDGEFRNLTSGTIYKSYDRNINRSNEEVKKDGNRGEPLFIGMDFNVTNMAATIYVKRTNSANDEEWHAVDEIKNGFDTPEIIETINNRYNNDDIKHDITIYPDSTGKSRKTVNASISDLSLLRKAGYRVRAKSTNPIVKNRILAVNSAFKNKRVWINDKKCKTTANCLEQQVYDDNGEPDKKNGKDHQNDATGYPVVYEMPVSKPIAMLR